jgi:hypothetical protein
MEMPKFTGDEDKDEINTMEWLRMVKENVNSHFLEILKFNDESLKWWYSLDEGTRISLSWENFENFSQINGSRIKKKMGDA